MGRRDPILGGPLCGNAERARLGSVEVIASLRASDNRPPIYAATYWGSDNWKLAKTLFPFLEWFDGELVSADVGLLKPDPASSSCSRDASK
jgi:hypothetical protein